jgi:transcriptional regulator with XRE-family HTH domain
MLVMTKLPIERLVEFIVARRKAVGLTQRGLAQASGINPGTLANIEAGRVTKAPALGTLEQLARGLRMPAEDLIAIARGEEPRSEATPAGPSDHPFPPTPEEEALMERARRVGWGFDGWEMDMWTHPEDAPYRRSHFDQVEMMVKQAERQRGGR